MVGVAVAVVDHNVDGGWAWVVLASAFLTRIIIGGLMWAMNHYFVLFHTEFGESRSYTALICSITYATYFSTAPLASILTQRYDVRLTTIIGSSLAAISYVLNVFATGVLYLIITHGLLLGVGFCLISNASLISLGQYFNRYNYIVTGVSLAGTGVGVFIFAVLIPHLLSTYGWRGSMYIMAGIVLQVCISGSALFPKQNNTLVQKYMQPKIRELRRTSSILRSRSYLKCFGNAAPLLASRCFWCLNVSQFFFCMSAIALIILYKDYAIMRDLEDVFAWSLAAFGLGDIVGRILSGFLISFPMCNAPILLFTTDIVTVILIMILYAMESSVGFIVCSHLLGIGIGSQVALQYIMPNDIFGREKYIVALGYVQTTAGIGSLIGPPIAGVITDVDFTYTWTFIFIAFLQLMSAISILFVICFQNKRYTETISSQTDAHAKPEVFFEADPCRKNSAKLAKRELSEFGTL